MKEYQLLAQHTNPRVPYKTWVLIGLQELLQSCSHAGSFIGMFPVEITSVVFFLLSYNFKMLFLY